MEDITRVLACRIDANLRLKKKSINTNQEKNPLTIINGNKDKKMVKKNQKEEEEEFE